MSRNGQHLFTSESVTEGHPDKIADQISDSILDALIAQDPMSRVACETLVTTGIAFIAGEITTKAVVDFQTVARETIKKIGYDNTDYGIDYRGCAVLVAITVSRQTSPWASIQVAPAIRECSGMRAPNRRTDAAPDLFRPQARARPLLRVAMNHEYLRPDGKSQVTVEYDGNKPVRVDVVGGRIIQKPLVTNETMREDITDKIINRVIPEHMRDKDTKVYVNPTGRFVVGGPHGDAGVTGRKIIVDTYGGAAPHGGGAFSGKDPTKVDRSACYMARYIAKNVVAAGLAERALVQLAYAIGVADPVSVMVHTEGTGHIPEERITEIVRAHFKLTPRGIMEKLDLRRPIYKKTAAGSNLVVGPRVRLDAGARSPRRAQIGGSVVTAL